MTEAELQRAIRAALGCEPDLDLYRNTTGQTEEWNPTTGRARTIRYGIAVGSSDLIGCLAPLGRWFALEIKTATGRVSPEQTKFLERIRSRGGFGAVVRSVAEARAALDRARMGANQ